jgi:hypothetical protein
MAHLQLWAGITGKSLPNRYTNTLQNYPQSHTQVGYLSRARDTGAGSRATMKLQECPMCGTSTDRTFKKQYRYDNGEVFTTWVCNRCAKVHADSLVSK